jgi:hypothetical protein
LVSILWKNSTIIDPLYDRRVAPPLLRKALPKKSETEKEAPQSPQCRQIRRQVRISMSSLSHSRHSTTNPPVIGIDNFRTINSGDFSRSSDSYGFQGRVSIPGTMGQRLSGMESRPAE